jgi:hypothetical protein
MLTEEEIQHIEAVSYNWGSSDYPVRCVGRLTAHCREQAKRIAELEAALAERERGDEAWDLLAAGDMVFYRFRLCTPRNAPEYWDFYGESLKGKCTSGAGVTPLAAVLAAKAAKWIC